AGGAARLAGRGCFDARTLTGWSAPPPLDMTQRGGDPRRTTARKAAREGRQNELGNGSLRIDDANEGGNMPASVADPIFSASTSTGNREYGLFGVMAAAARGELVDLPRMAVYQRAPLAASPLSLRPATPPPPKRPKLQPQRSRSSSALATTRSRLVWSPALPGPGAMRLASIFLLGRLWPSGWDFSMIWCPRPLVLPCWSTQPMLRSPRPF